MYEKFGEFDSFEEINKSAAGLKAEGDKESLLVLAKENGIDDYMIDMFMDGDVDVICDLETAAIGKVEVESKDLKAEGIMYDWVDYVKGCIVKDNDMAVAVRKKSKSLRGCIAELLKTSYKNCKPVDKDVCKLAGVPSNCKLGMPGMSEAKKIIRHYYLGR